MKDTVAVFGKTGFQRGSNLGVIINISQDGKWNIYITYIIYMHTLYTIYIVHLCIHVCGMYM